MPKYVKVATTDEIPDDSGKCVEVRGIRVAIFRLDGAYHAVDDMCTHADASLAEGVMAGDEVVCPLHAATFNIRTGACTGPPADMDLNTYSVRVVGDDIEVEV
jgi:NAD(P)H-dependent nitrite reductase small subunit